MLSLKTCQSVSKSPQASANPLPPLLSRGTPVQGREHFTPAMDGTRGDDDDDENSCEQYRSPDSRSNNSFYSLGTKICGKLQKGNMNMNNKMTLEWCARWMAHSTVDLVMPWFLGSVFAPPPSAHDIGGGWGQ